MADELTAFAVLATSGPSPADDAIAHVAALRAGPQGAREEFAEATGAARRSGAKAVVRRMLRFCSDAPVVVYDAATFTSFVGAAGVKAPECLDCMELARIALPDAADYSLRAVAERLGEPTDGGDGAADDALLLSRVWSALLRRMAELPPTVLDVVCAALAAAGSPLGRVVSDHVARRSGFELSGEPARGLADLFPSHRALIQRAQKQGADELGEEAIPTDAICRMFAPGGAVGRSLPGYEQRPEQVEMVRAVCDAFNEPHHLFAEAGTGTGKSLAYLMPAVAWALTNGDKVVVSTNTRNLQEQLFHKDAPFLTELLSGRFEPALLKGRRNYLCLRRFLRLMRHFERELVEPEQLMALAPLVAWASQTESGDLAECNGFLLSPGAATLTPAIVTGPGECAGRACRLRDRCFVNRARARAQLADLIIVNHALLFAELGLDSRVLPPYRCVVFDEAHNLEDVATDALAAVVDGPSVYRVTNFLYRARRDGSGSGLLSTAMAGARGLSGARAERAAAAVGSAMRAVDQVVQAARRFLKVIAEPFGAVPPSVDRILLRECFPGLGRGSPAWDTVTALRESVESLGGQMDEAAKLLGQGDDAEDDGNGLAHDLRAQAVRLREVCEAAGFILAQEDESFVYWLERTQGPRGTHCSLHAAPTRVGEYVRDLILKQKRCVVMTSATLQVEGNFDYAMERLGADGLAPGKVRCAGVGSPFDYDRQALIGVATFLPDPGGVRDKTFDAELSAFLTDLLLSTKGRALVLFTSYSLLDCVYEAIGDALRRAGVAVLAQGHAGSREAMLSTFRTAGACVLLGTRSFWEGVDVAGEALSCLVLTKLPFHVITDPLVQGRMDHLRNMGRDPFAHYTLPEAVISFRQGLGRLIRTRGDTGVVLVTDKRLVTKPYGRTFLSSLPTGHRVLRSPEEAIEAVEAFLREQPTTVNDRTAGPRRRR